MSVNVIEVWIVVVIAGFAFSPFFALMELEYGDWIYNLIMFFVPPVVLGLSGGWLLFLLFVLNVVLGWI